MVFTISFQILLEPNIPKNSSIIFHVYSKELYCTAQEYGPNGQLMTVTGHCSVLWLQSIIERFFNVMNICKEIHERMYIPDFL